MSSTAAATRDLATLQNPNGAALDEARAVESGDPVELAIADLRALREEASLVLGVRAGQIVVRRIFGDDIDSLRRRGPKPIAISRLANHPDLPMSKAALAAAVGVYEMLSRLGLLRDLQALGDVGYTNLQIVLRAPRPEQSDLIERARSNHWSTRRMNEEVLSLTRRPPRQLAGRSQIGRNAVVRQLRKALEHLANADTAAAMDREALSEMAEIISKLENRMAALRSEIGLGPSQRKD